MINPFSGYGQVVGGDRLVGRESQVRLLEDRVGAHASLSIVGMRRIGKTSLLAEACERIRRSRPERPIVWLSVGTLPGPTEFFRALLNRAIDAAQVGGWGLPSDLEAIRHSETSSSYVAFERCEEGLWKLHGLGVEVILAVDEFDAVRHFDDAGIFIQRLRELIQHQARYGLTAVFASRRTLLAIEKQVADVSTLDGACEKLFLTCLDQPAMEQMALRGGPAWAPDPVEMATLWDVCGGQPYLCETILCHAWDERAMTAGLEAASAELFDFYDHARTLLEEDGLFDELLQIAVGPRWSVRVGTSERLKRHGFLREVASSSGEGGGRRSLTGYSKHFQEYLGKCAREASAWELWRETETTLRAFIDDRCSAEYGHGWLVAIGKRNPSVAAIQHECEARQQRERHNFGLAGAVSLLDYTYPMELWKVIAAEWRLFGPLLGRDKNYWNERFGLLAKIRTPDAHNRGSIIPEFERQTAQGYCQELLAVLRGGGTPSLA